MLIFLFSIMAVIVLCVFRRKKLFSGSLDIGHDHSFCKTDKHVWLPRFCKYDPRSKDEWAPNYEAVQLVFRNKIIAKWHSFFNVSQHILRSAFLP